MKIIEGYDELNNFGDNTSVTYIVLKMFTDQSSVTPFTGKKASLSRADGEWFTNDYTKLSHSRRTQVSWQ